MTDSRPPWHEPFPLVKPLDMGDGKPTDWREECEKARLERDSALDTVCQLKVENAHLRQMLADLRDGRTIQNVIDDSRP